MGSKNVPGATHSDHDLSKPVPVTRHRYCQGLNIRMINITGETYKAVLCILWHLVTYPGNISRVSPFLISFSLFGLWFVCNHNHTPPQHSPHCHMWISLTRINTEHIILLNFNYYLYFYNILLPLALLLPLAYVVTHRHLSVW